MARPAAQWTTLTPVAAHATRPRSRRRTTVRCWPPAIHAGVDRYVMELALPEGTITGIRLEALPDPSLPKGGPGRDYYGNFVLTGFHVDHAERARRRQP